MSATVLDVGAGENPDARADETLDIQPPADHVADLEAEWPIDTASVAVVIATHVVEHLSDLEHFFEEAGRVLIDGGRLEITVPLGEDALTDHDHKTVWRFCTPEQFSRSHQRAWDPEVPFDLLRRQLSVWGQGPETIWTSPLAQVAAELWPAWVAHRAPAGELTARYRRRFR